MEPGVYNFRVAGLDAGIAGNISGDEQYHVIATAGLFTTVYAEQGERPGNHEAALFAGLATGGFGHGFVQFDPAAGKVETGNVGVFDEEHPTPVVKRGEAHTERQSRAKEIGPGGENVAGEELQPTQQTMTWRQIRRAGSVHGGLSGG